MRATALLGLCCVPWRPETWLQPRRPPCLLGQQDSNEFARPLSLSTLQRRARRSCVEATPEECAALASRFELEGIGSLSANVSLSLVDKRRTRVRAFGTLSAADVRRHSSFTGETTTLQVDALPFETFFRPEEELDVSSDNDDEFKFDEGFQDDQIDVGELVAQHMYIHIFDLAMEEQSEWDEDNVEGTVVYDTNPDLDM